MLTLLGLGLVALSVLIITASAMVTAQYIPLSMSKTDYRPPAISWIHNEPNAWVSSHWTGFNLIAMASSAIMGVITLFCSPFGQAFTTGGQGYSDFPMSILAVESACMLGFHAVWSTGLDWRFHKIPRWSLVSHILIQLAFTVTCCVLSPGYAWMILSIIMISIICWLSGLLPGSGMSDGRLYVIVAACTVPFLWISTWLPVAIACVAAIINAIVSSVTGGALIHAERNTRLSLGKRLMTAKSPMGPFVSIAFLACYMVYITGLLVF